MKKLLLSLISLVLIVSCSGRKTFIEGKIEGLPTTIYLYEYGGTSAVLVDSTTAKKDGSFKFRKGNKKQGEYGIRETKGVERDIKRFFVDNDPIFVNGDTENTGQIEVKGDVSDSLYRNFRKMGGAMNQDTLKKYVDLYKDFVVAPHIIARHMGNNSTPYQTMDSLIDLLPENIQETTYGKRARFLADAKRNTQIGAKFTEIEEQDVNGEIHKLSDVIKKNKYTLLTFWASWCGDCRENIPYIKNAYNSYKNEGLGIYSVSMDYSKAEWESFLERNDIEWTNVSDVKGWDCVPADKYFVRTITTTYIFDHEGKIIEKFLKKEALGNRIDELFGNMPTYVVPTENQYPL